MRRNTTFIGITARKDNSSTTGSWDFPPELGLGWLAAWDNGAVNDTEVLFPLFRPFSSSLPFLRCLQVLVEFQKSSINPESPQGTPKVLLEPYQVLLGPQILTEPPKPSLKPTNSLVEPQKSLLTPKSSSNPKSPS